MAGSPEREPNPRPEETSPAPDSPPAQESSESASRYKGQTVWIVKAGQLVGLAIGVNQGLLEQTPNRDLVALAIFLVLGAQAAENLLFRMIDRFFDRASG